MQNKYFFKSTVFFEIQNAAVYCIIVLYDKSQSMLFWESSEVSSFKSDIKVFTMFLLLFSYLKKNTQTLFATTQGQGHANPLIAG